MRKLYLMAAIMAALLLAAVSALGGYYAGIRHAITDAEIWTVGNPGTYADWEIYIDLDGQEYIHELYIG